MTGLGERIQFVLTAVIIIAAVALGGGQGGLGDTFVQLLGLSLMACIVVNETLGGRSVFTRRSPAWLVVLVLAVPLLQVALLALDIPRQPMAVERALWSLIPACAVYLSVLGLEVRKQRWLLFVLFGMALSGLLLGLMQLAEGSESSLRLYSNTNATQAVGFFANRNHLAALFLMCLPFSLALATSLVGEQDSDQPIPPFRTAIAVGVATLMIFGIAMTQSRAGLLLGMLGLLVSVPMSLSLRRRKGIKRGYVIVVAVATLLTVQFAFFGVLQRLAADPQGDDRWHFAEVTVEAAREASFFGTGLGTFRHVFQAHDTETPGRAIVNHAHNDYLELWLEAGWPFVAAALLFIGLILRRGIQSWRSPDRSNSLWPKAASIAVMLMLLHSAFDFPLRTTTNQAVFALALGVLFSWRPAPADKGISQHGIRPDAG